MLITSLDLRSRNWGKPALPQAVSRIYDRPRVSVECEQQRVWLLLCHHRNVASRGRWPSLMNLFADGQQLRGVAPTVPCEQEPKHGIYDT